MEAVLQRSVAVESDYTEKDSKCEREGRQAYSVVYYIVYYDTLYYMLCITFDNTITNVYLALYNILFLYIIYLTPHIYTI